MPKVYVVKPESFHITQCLPPDLWLYGDDALYFIHLLMTKQHKADAHGVVRLRAEHLADIMRKDQYAAVIRALIDCGAVERFDYVRGVKSTGYRLSARFASDRHVRVPLTDGRLINKLKRHYARVERESLGRMQPVHHALASAQQSLEIHAEKARRILDSSPESNPFDSQGVLVDDIAEKRWRFRVGNYFRVTNNITSLKRALRPSLHVSGVPLVGIDFCCAQPALLAKMMQHGVVRASTSGRQQARGREGHEPVSNNDSGQNLPGGGAYDHCPEFQEFRQRVQNGTFYKFLRTKVSGLTVDELKKRVLCDVFAKRKANAAGAEYPSEVEDAFRLWLPPVYEYIREFNGDGYKHANLIRELQRQEARWVIEIVGADFVTRNPGVFVVPLHDALYTTSEHVTKVEDAIGRACERTGFTMTYKVDGR